MISTSVRTMRPCGPSKALLCGRPCPRSAALFSPRRPTRRPAPGRVSAASSTPTPPENETHKKEMIGKIEESLRASGMDAAAAKTVLKKWQDDIGHDISTDALRKLLVGQSTKAIALVAFSTLLDAGAAYGAFNFGGFLGQATEQYGFGASVLQAVAYLGAGWYATGAVFDLFKLGAMTVAAINFNVNSAAFLAAVEDIAGAGTGLNVADKALEAVNSVKVLQSLTTMSDLLRQQSVAGSSSSGDMLADLGAFLTLNRAQTAFGFNAEKFGLTDAQAAEIAVVFGRYDLNDDGVLSLDEFKKLCVDFAPELNSDAEIAAAMAVVDSNKDGSIDFLEFAKFWQANMAPPAARAVDGAA